MRIGILTNYHLEQVGGAEEALDRLAGHWHQAGHEVLLWASPSRRPDAPRRPWQPAYECRTIARPFSTRWGLSWWVRPLRRAQAQQPLDLLVASDAYWPGHVARLFAQATGVPYVIYSHGGDCMHGSRFLTRPVTRQRMALAVQNAAGVACISHYVGRQLAALAQPRGQVRWIPNGWPDEWSAATRTPRPVAWPYLFAMGRCVALKGFQTLLAAYQSLRGEFPELGLVIAGDGSYRQRLWEQADAAGLNPRQQLAGPGPGVVLPGFVHGDQKRALVEHALVGVCPSIREEPQGMVVLEMLCRGVPVIASRVGGIPDMVDERRNGELFTAGDAEELAARLREWLREPGEISRRAAAAAESVAEFRWSLVAKRYLELFESILASRPAAARLAPPHFLRRPTALAGPSAAKHEEPRGHGLAT